MREFNREFYRKLKTDLGDAEFSFNIMAGKRLYFISVNDNNHNSHFFKMQAKGGKWVIVEKKVPDWIIKLKDELSDAIIEHRAKYP